MRNAKIGPDLRLVQIPAGLLPVFLLLLFLFFSFIVFLLFGLFLFILSDSPF